MDDDLRRGLRGGHRGSGFRRLLVLRLREGHQWSEDQCVPLRCHPGRLVPQRRADPMGVLHGQEDWWRAGGASGCRRGSSPFCRCQCKRRCCRRSQLGAAKVASAGFAQAASRAQLHRVVAELLGAGYCCQQASAVGPRRRPGGRRVGQQRVGDHEHPAAAGRLQALGPRFGRLRPPHAGRLAAERRRRLELPPARLERRGLQQVRRQNASRTESACRCAPQQAQAGAKAEGSGCIVLLVILGLGFTSSAWRRCGVLRLAREGRAELADPRSHAG
mmetsp:Transcript_93653/g.269652  ORF Transcript_93653/g.269652 Transcript_93653/m.269652 type:complete len:275 (-) Transcript_93653:868-1692(-)